MSIMLKEKKSDYASCEGITFPSFKTVRGNDSWLHEEKIKISFNISQQARYAGIFSQIENSSEKVKEINVEGGNFELSDVFKMYGIQSNTNVFLNWGQFKEIDIISLELLSMFFYDIWYPGSDDIYVYDDSFSWIVNVTHYGAVLILKK